MNQKTLFKNLTIAGISLNTCQHDLTNRYLFIWDNNFSYLGFIDTNSSEFHGYKGAALNGSGIKKGEDTETLLSFGTVYYGLTEVTKTINKLVIFDKDDTLVTTKSGKDFPVSPSDQKPLFDFSVLKNDYFDAEDGIHYKIIYAIASNQKGIKLKHKTKDFLSDELWYLVEELKFPATIVLCCPDDGETLWRWWRNQKIGIKDVTRHHSGNFRKPNAGMLLAAKGIVISTSRYIQDMVFIGDNQTDEQAAIEAGCKYIYIDEWLKTNNLQKL